MLGTYSAHLKTIIHATISTILLLPVPWMTIVIGICLAWDRFWLAFQKTKIAVHIGKSLKPIFHRIACIIMKDERNAPYLYSLFGIGLYAPILFISALYWKMYYDVDSVFLLIFVALVYHVLLMGPYFRFFSYVATLIHKEGHETRGFFKKPFGFLNHSFGWFLGIFYGHVPEIYPLGHLRIHHKYDNGPEDITSTLAFDRRKPLEWCNYLRKFSLMWSGISPMAYFITHKQWSAARRMACGMAVYYGLMITSLSINLWFGFSCFLLPHMCVIIYLSAINWVWHIFCDPHDLENPYINSITILKGHYNIFNEDFHVTHHLQPQLHWTKVEQYFYDNEPKYRENMASIFIDTQEFEIFIWIMLKRYDLLAQHFVDLTNQLSSEEKIALLKYRLQPIP